MNELRPSKAVKRVTGQLSVHAEGGITTLTAGPSRLVIADGREIVCPERGFENARVAGTGIGLLESTDSREPTLFIVLLRPGASSSEPVDRALVVAEVDDSSQARERIVEFCELTGFRQFGTPRQGSHGSSTPPSPEQLDLLFLGDVEVSR